MGSFRFVFLGLLGISLFAACNRAKTNGLLTPPSQMTRELVNASDLVCIGKAEAITPMGLLDGLLPSFAERDATFLIDRVIRGGAPERISVSFFCGAPTRPFRSNPNATLHAGRTYEEIPSERRCLLLLKKDRKNHYRLTDDRAPILNLSKAPSNGSLVADPMEVLAQELRLAVSVSDPLVAIPAIKAITALNLDNNAIRTALYNLVSEADGQQGTKRVPSSIRATAFSALVSLKEWKILFRLAADWDAEAFTGVDERDVLLSVTQIADPNGLPALGKCFETDALPLKRAAATALRNIHDVRAVSYLGTALRDQDEWIQFCGIHGLYAISKGNSRPAAPSLEEFKRNRERYVAEWLKWLGDTDLAPNP